MKKFNLSSKSLSTIGKKKKNAFIFLIMGAVLLAFIFSIYNDIDVEGAIKAEMKRNKVLDNPDLKKDSNNSSDTKISWAINIENTIDNMKSNQERIVLKMSKQTKEEIVAGNAIILNEIRSSNKLLKGKMGELTDKNLKLSKQIAALQNKTSSNINALNKRINQQTEEFGNYMEDNVLLPPPPLNNVNQIAQSPTRDGELFNKINIVKNILIPEKKVIKKKLSFEVISYKNEFTDENGTTGEELTAEEIKKRNTFEIITGFTDGYLITGAYAPLFGESSGQSSQPIPVLIETNGDLLMPNNTIGSIDKCFVLGVATGNAGARSVEIRLDKMTCLVGDSKRILQGKINGYVVSESGTPGLPATMIYKAGDFIGRMIAAGILEGISSAVVNYASGYGSAANSGTQAYGSTMSGAGGGMSNAFTKLSDFYLQLAEATLPILEVKPGRFISLVLVGGNKFELKEINLLDTREVDNFIDEFIGE